MRRWSSFFAITVTLFKLNIKDSPVIKNKQKRKHNPSQQKQTNNPASMEKGEKQSYRCVLVKMGFKGRCVPANRFPQRGSADDTCGHPPD